MSTATVSMKVCEYKGRKYLLVWAGQTKFGQRAKLAFLDGSAEFWVDLSRVSTQTSKPAVVPAVKPAPVAPVESKPSLGYWRCVLCGADSQVGAEACSKCGCLC
jgi:hypothetical protein